jgi:hypothetical protein
MEILDVFNNIRSQVAERQMKQVSVFPDTVLPKTQRDLVVEVNVDKGIEAMNRLLESKLGSLEYFVQNINVENRGAPKGELSERAVILPYSQAYQQVIGTGELAPLWNSIVRAYQTNGLSKQSQEIIKVKMQELKGNLDAMKYGLRSGIQTIFEHKIIDAQIALKILELLRSLSVYTLISLQADTGMFEQITVERLESSYKNVLQSLSMEQIHILQRHSKVGNVIESPIRNIPLFGNQSNEARLKEVADELGFKVPPELLKRLVALPASDFDLAVTKLKNEAKSVKASTNFTQEETQELNQISELAKSIAENTSELEQLGMESARLTEQIDKLSRDPEPADPDIEEPEEVKEPEFPDVAIMFEDEDYYEELMERYRNNMEDYKRYQEQLLDYRLAKQNAESDEKFRALQRQTCIRQYDRIKKEVENTMEAIEADELLYDYSKRSLSEFKRIFSEKATRAMKVILDSAGKELKLHKKTRQKYITIPMEREELEEVKEESEEEESGGEGSGSEEEEEGMGYGKPDLRGRGLSTMKSNYGTRPRPSKSRGPMHFDDTRNESFYSKPK